ncbi:MAG: winged helix-turn-helix domain-containing protein [Thermoanaerobaculia bacterium]|nr:winged helix-turn-helix domain-containing protein [Thermoanaerobaculia bacterium]
MDLLIALARRAGETVSKKSLLGEVWRGAFVVESVLPKTVSALRQALGDSVEKPKFVLTVRGKGYRLVAEVLPVTDPETDPKSEAVAAATDPIDLSLAPDGWLAVGRSRLLLFFVVGSILLSFFLASRAILQSMQGVEEPISRLAVVPFSDRTPSGGGEALTVALRAELLGELSRFERPSVFPIEPRPADHDGGLTVAREIDADGLLEGDVTDLGNRIRIDLRLIEIASGKQRWSTSIERSTEELWSFRREVAQSLFDQLDVGVHRERSLSFPSTALSSRSVPPEIYRSYLEARFLWTRRSNEGLEKAELLFSEVTQKAPEFGEGFAWLALAGVTRSNYLGGDARAHFEAAESAAKRALELAPDLPTTQIAAGQVAINIHTDAQTAVARYSRAVELAPNLAMAHQYLAEALSASGEHERAIAAADSAVALAPISSIQHGIRGVVLNAAGRWEDAVEAFDRALILDGHFWIFRWRGYALVRLGDEMGAIVEFRRFAELAGEDPAALVRLDEAARSEGLDGYWNWLYERYLYQDSQGRHPRPMEWAEVFAGTGRLEAALQQIELASTIGQGEHFLQLRVSPALDALREDPRFIELYLMAGSSPAITGGPS